MKTGLKTIQQIVRAKNNLQKMVAQSCVPISYVKLNFVTGECRVKLKGKSFRNDVLFMTHNLTVLNSNILTRSFTSHVLFKIYSRCGIEKNYAKGPSASMDMAR